MKQIQTQGISFLHPLQENASWYWGSDYTNGDLYEAEALFKQGNPIQKNRLIFIHYPDGTLIEPIKAEIGQYFGRPTYDQGQLILLLVDFIQQKINLFGYDPNTEQTALLVDLPLSIAKDCYNLMPCANPLMLTRQGEENLFQILWPERREIQLSPTECFDHREGNLLYFTAWFEDPDAREEVIVRDIHTGNLLRRMDGSLVTMPGGLKWLLV